MSMPALQAFRRKHPALRLVLLAKRALHPLWRMSGLPDVILGADRGLRGTLRTVEAARREGCGTAYVLPHSLRSALLPLLAQIPVRIGLPGPFRGVLLSRVILPRLAPGRMHQSYEYLDLLAPGSEGPLEPPRLTLEAGGEEAAGKLLGEAGGPWVGLLPGAARGPSKQWPSEHFAELGRRLAADGWQVAVMGSAADAACCGHIAESIGTSALNLGGRTPLAVWAACLARCRAVVANDSGGMHLAAALGTPVVALYGLTDPARTGPLGPARILQRGPPRGRDVPPDSREARLRMASIAPEAAHRALMELTGDHR
jgi:heptosyltransferase-2